MKKTELLELPLAEVEKAQEVICSFLCPTTWKTGIPQPHCELCKAFTNYIESKKAESDIQWTTTPEEALVLAAWEVVRQTAERPSGE